MSSMTTMNGNKGNLLDLYHHAVSSSQNELSRSFWGDLPHSYNDIIDKVPLMQQKIGLSNFEDRIERLTKIILTYQKKLGLLSSEVKEHSNNFVNGLVSVGHQPLLFGGPVFLPSKITQTEWLSKQTNLGCFLSIGDHDFIQNELITSRFPQINSVSGLFFKPNQYDKYKFVPVHKLPVPNEKWLKEAKNKVNDNLRLLMKQSKIRNDLRLLLFDRADQWFQIIYESAISSNSFSEWVQKIWGSLLILKNNLNLLFLPTSSIEFRKMSQSAFEYLIKEENRKIYYNSLNEMHTIISENNYAPGIPIRNKNYAPFFYECTSCINRTRFELFIDSPGTITGKCPVCNEEYSYSYDINNPDLSEIGVDITPRSDSRSAVMSILFPIMVHIGGGGETIYHSSVIPSMKKIGLNTPTFVRSNRYWYQTPWSDIKSVKYEPKLISKELYAIFDQFNKSTDNETTNKALKSMKMHISSIKTEMLSTLTSLELNLKSSPSNKKLQSQIRELEIYLSLQFGRYEKDKFTQEISWNWFDLGILTGLNNVSDTIKRQLRLDSFPGSTWMINPGKFT